MSTRISLTISTIVVAVVAVALLLVGTSQAAAIEAEGTAVERTTEGEVGAAVIQVTERFSIPFGFDDSLALTDDGGSVVVSGQGACTDGEAITIAFTLTQSTGGGSVTGLWDGTCTGAVQTWTKVTSNPSLSAGPATACAFAETRANDSVTDSQDWCDPVILTAHTIFLPRVLEP